MADSREPQDFDEFPHDLEEFLEDVPEEKRGPIIRMMGMSMQMSRVVSPEAELMRKMTPENIDNFLDGQKKAQEYGYKEGIANKIFYGFIVVIVLAFIVGLVVLLKDKPDILEKVLYSVGGLIVGLIGGYGYGRTKRPDD